MTDELAVVVGLTGPKTSSSSAAAACAGVGALPTSHHMADVGVFIRTRLHPVGGLPADRRAGTRDRHSAAGAPSRRGTADPAGRVVLRHAATVVDQVDAAARALPGLHLVAAGCGITIAPTTIAPMVPAGMRVPPVRGGPAEQRRIPARTVAPTPDAARRSPDRRAAHRGDRDGPGGTAQPHHQHLQRHPGRSAITRISRKAPAQRVTGLHW